jgi:H+-transporting ATPase
VDQAALTGESLPVTLFEGESVKMGSTVVRGEVEATVAATGGNTFFGKTAALLQGGRESSNLEKMLLRIMLVLVMLSLALCSIAFGFLLMNGEHMREALSFTVVLLVASIPIAIEIVCTTTLALGSRHLSKDGAIVSRLAAIEDMAGTHTPQNNAWLHMLVVLKWVDGPAPCNTCVRDVSLSRSACVLVCWCGGSGMDMLCSDKTGTLTLNKMVIQEQTPVYLQGETQYSLLRYAAMAARWKEPPRDALDTLVLNAVDMPSLDKVVQSDYMPFDPTVKRTEGTITLPSGETFKATKGAPHILLHLIDDEDIKKAVEHDVELLGERGIRCLAVARTAGNDMKQWVMLGLLTFLDPPRPDTKDTIEKAQALGVQVKMITGDHKLIAKETARVLGLGTEIGDATGLPMLLEGGKIPSDLMNYFPLIERGNGFAQVFPVCRTHTPHTLRRASRQGASGAHTVLSSRVVVWLV